ncbi:MAG: non-ribosomal peptide synthetase, partial [Rhizobacter sp.]|nr:non-ribosomal peptide synthetase [Ferruginibacter sp.]
MVELLEKNMVAVDYNPFGESEIQRITPCTEPQVEILTACLMGGDDANRAFNESITLKFAGLLNRLAVEYALQKLISRHESLRCGFSVKKMQICIFKVLNIPLYYRDISAQDDSLKNEIVKKYIEQDSLHLFDLVNGPLLKAGLIKLNARSHCFVLTVHHIVCDGWSLGILLQDLGKLYSSYVQNTMINLPKVVSFSQFAREQHIFFKSEECRQIEKYWEDLYSDHVPVLNLPTDFTRPAIRTYKSNRLDYRLDNNLVAPLKMMGTKAGSSLVITLLSAFEAFLYRLTGQDDIVIGLPAAGQSVTNNYNLVGHCVNLLPLRSNPTSEISFLNYLQKRKKEIFDAYDHQQ